MRPGVDDGSRLSFTGSGNESTPRYGPRPMRSPRSAGWDQRSSRQLRRERRRLIGALLLSLLIHGLLLSLTFDERGLGLPGFGAPWQDRRTEVPELRVVIVPARGATAEPTPPPAAEPLQMEPLAPPPAVATAAPPSSDPAPTLGGPATVIVGTAQPAALADAATGGLAASEPSPSDGQDGPALAPAQAVLALAPPVEEVFVVPPAPSVPTPATAAAPSASSPAAVTPVARAPDDSTREQSDREAQERIAERSRLERAQQEAQRQAERLARQREADAAERARREEAAARQEAERQQAARQEAARLEVARQEAARQDVARVEAARVEAARVEAARVEAARVEAARVEAARVEATRMEAARSEAVQLQLARRQAEESARREPASQAAPAPVVAGPAPPPRAAEAASRPEPPPAARVPPLQATTSSGARRRTLFGRTDPNVDLVLYAETWRRKIELNMTFDLVREAVKLPHADPVVTVALRSNGTVESVTFNRSSGVAQIDEAIRRVVHSQAPYQAFPPDLAREFDVIEIRRTWLFDMAIRLY
jgi:hypothetical protein